MCARQDALMITPVTTTPDVLYLVEAKCIKTHKAFTIRDLQICHDFVRDGEDRFLIAKCSHHNIPLIMDNTWRVSKNHAYIYRTMPLALSVFPACVREIVYEYYACLGEFVGKLDVVDLHQPIFGDTLHNRIVSAVTPWVQTAVTATLFDSRTGSLRVLKLKRIVVNYFDSVRATCYTHNVRVEVELYFDDDVMSIFGWRVAKRDGQDLDNVVIAYARPPQSTITVQIAENLCDVCVLERTGDFTYHYV